MDHHGGTGLLRRSSRYGCDSCYVAKLLRRVARLEDTEMKLDP